MTFTTNWFNGRKEQFKKHLKNPKRILEIGTWEGQGAVWFKQNYDATVEVIDPFTGSVEHDVTGLEERFNENTKGLGIVAYKGLSKDTLPGLGMFDCIYIDGSHKASDVIFDLVVGWEHLNEGGIMGMDDYTWKQEWEETERPQMAIDAFLNIYKGQYKLLYKKSYVIIRKTLVHV